MAGDQALAQTVRSRPVLLQDEAQNTIRLLADSLPPITLSFIDNIVVLVERSKQIVDGGDDLREAAETGGGNRQRIEAYVARVQGKADGSFLSRHRFCEEGHISCEELFL